MSTNGKTAAEAQASKPSTTAPKGYTKWFDVEFKNVIFDPAIFHRQEAIKGYYTGYITGYNVIRHKKYSVLFEWSEVPSQLPNCKDYTLHVFISPAPTIIRKATRVMSASLDSTAELESDTTINRDEDVIDPPTPPKPPPPTM
jgi:hypothetical protein